MASSRWTYKVVDLKPGFLGLKPDAVQDALNQLGAQGWELVTVQPHGLTLRLFMKKGA